MKLTNRQLKQIIKEELTAVLSEMGEMTPLQKFKAGLISYDEWQASLWPSEDSVMSPEEQAAQAEKYPAPDHDAVTRTGPTPKFDTEVPGPSGEVTIQGIPMMADEDDDMAYIEDNGVKQMNITNEQLRNIIQEELEAVLAEVEELEEEEIDEAKKKKPCKPSKGKRFAKRVNGKCRSYGQKGQAKGGGDRIRPGTKKGDAYCARSAKIKKCKNPPCANDLSRKKWKCRGSKSMK